MSGDPLPQAAYAPPARESDGMPVWSEDMVVLHAELVSRIRREQQPPDALTEMLIERAATTYVFLKRKDASGFDNDRASREAHATFLDMVREIRKSGVAFNPTQELAERMAEVVIAATEDLPPEVRNKTRETLADQLGSLLAA